MNKWECEAPDCGSTAVGCGGAVGLRAIGWYMVPGLTLYCPLHRPDARVVRTNLHPDGPRDTPCSPCTAETEAAYFQRELNGHFGFESTETLEAHARLYPALGRKDG